MYYDSMDKIMMYITSIIKGEVIIDGKKYFEKNIFVSPKMLREISCVRHCGACCCSSFTLDYLPSEAPEGTIEREIYGKKIFSYPYTHGLKYCEKLSLENGDCLIHEHRPFSCDFEMLRFKQFKQNKVLIGTYPYGRCWNLTQYNGEKGGLCVTKSYSEEYKKDVIRKLYRLKDWIDYFDIPTYIDEIISFVENLNTCEGSPMKINFKSFLFEN